MSTLIQIVSISLLFFYWILPVLLKKRRSYTIDINTIFFVIDELSLLFNLFGVSCFFFFSMLTVEYRALYI